ncbi:hypothetical protein F2Q68_00021336 [Brassica cretica]|uniref:RNase H type-1 domain-containing protein n=1 Tax=Brassica cretica TaxID=69181 RepID=A0A8S9FWX3_BRACR|nr:hypothetical protein F2Q68_00021336 [Brassica cretica]
MNETEEETEEGKESDTHLQNMGEEGEPQGEKTVEILLRPKVVEEVETVSEAVTGREVEKQIEKSVEDEEPTVGKSGSCELQGGLRDQANSEVEVSMETEKDWSSVSPGKVGRSVEKHDAQTVISPSRFQLLVEADDDEQSTTQESVMKVDNLSTGNLVDDAEEGEILQHDGENLQPKKDGKVSNPARPARVTLRMCSRLVQYSYFILYNNIVPRRSRRIELGNERDETHGLTKECFESDCQQLVRLIQDPKAWLALGPELDEIDSLSSEFTTFSFCFIPRSDNVRAEFLAKACRSLAQNFSFLDDKAPPRLAHETCLFE